MNVTEIPFNKLLRIKAAANGSGMLLELDEDACYLNHVGTVHASAQMALAEAGSGQVLLDALGELHPDAIAVVRRVEAKFRSPMKGKIAVRAVSSPAELRRAAEPLAGKGRAIIPVTVETVDMRGTVGLAATFEWFAQKR